MQSTNINTRLDQKRSGLGVLGQVEVVAYATYEEAQAAVDRLSDAGFPVERLTIVAKGLGLVERITGRRGYKQAIVSSALTGAIIGAALGFFFGFFDWVEPLAAGLVLAVNGILLGLVVGGILGAISQWMSAGRRDFSSQGMIRAESYSLLCDAPRADEAGRLLGR